MSEKLTAEEAQQIEKLRRERMASGRAADARMEQERQRRVDEQESARREEEDARAAIQALAKQELQRRAEERQRQETERATEEAGLRARSLALAQELAAAKTALTEAQTRVARARAFGDPGLKEARAAVIRGRREIEELAAALDVLDAELALIRPNVQFGRHKRVG